MVYHKILNIVVCAIQWDLVIIHSIYNRLHLLTPTSYSIPPLAPSALATIAYSLCLWVCFCFVDKFVCVLFQIPHISDIIWYLSFSDLLHLVWQSLVASMLQVAVLHSFYGWVVFHCIYVPHLIYAFNCWWTFSLFPCVHYYK